VTRGMTSKLRVGNVTLLPLDLTAPLLGTFVLATLAVLANARDARADPTKAECVEADTAAQNERRAEHLHAARQQLEVCSNPACPKLVRDDCTQRLSALDAIIPGIVFAAKDASGEDLIGVRVSVDGGVPSELSATALAVDPGVHTFRFAVDGAKPVEKKLVIREGEKARQERVTFADLNVPAGGAAAASHPEPVGSSSSWGTQKTAAIVLGGAGVVGVIVGSVMGAMSFSAWSSSQSECGGASCTDRTKALSDHNSALSNATVSDVGFIAGGVLVATGVVVFLTAPSAPGSPPRTGLQLVPTPVRGGGGVSLEGRF
jgi:hypothetical protein